jgi:hypothetical protein
MCPQCVSSCSRPYVPLCVPPRVPFVYPLVYTLCDPPSFLVYSHYCVTVLHGYPLYVSHSVNLCVPQPDVCVFLTAAAAADYLTLVYPPRPATAAAAAAASSSA